MQHVKTRVSRVALIFLALLGTLALVSAQETATESTAPSSLSEDQVSDKLRGIPVFVIVNEEGAPLVANVGDDEEQMIGIWFDFDTASETLAAMNEGEDPPEDNLQVQVSSFAEVYRQILTNPDATEKASLIPDPDEAAIALRLAKEQGYAGDEFTSVPLFVVQNPETGYLTVSVGDESVIPLFFSHEAAEELAERYRGEGETEVTIQLALLPNVLNILRTGPLAETEPLRFVPHPDARAKAQEMIDKNGDAAGEEGS